MMPKPNWAEVIRALGPIFGGVAAGGGPASTGFMSGYQESEQRIATERREREREAQNKRTVGGRYQLDMAERLLARDDPIEFEQLRGHAGRAAQDVYGLKPTVFDDLQFSESKATAKRLKEVEDLLDVIERQYGPEKLDEFASDPTYELKTTSGKVPLGAALLATRRRLEKGGQSVPVPKKAPPAATGTASERAAAIRQQIEEAMEKGDGTTADSLQRKYRNLLETEREFGEASRKPGDPELADLNKTLKELQIDKAKQPVDTELAGLNKTLKELQVETVRGRLEDRANKPAADLPPIVQRRVNQQEDSFKNEPAVKRANTIAEGYAFVKGLSDTSHNPADDQALIYAFAKAMDPESVVREGEYATVQKYAQEWLANFKFNAARVLTNSEFLTTEARKNIKATIRTKFAASKQSYDNVRRQYVTQLNRLTGLQDGESRLLDYAAGYTPMSGPADKPPVTVKSIRELR